MLITSWLYLYIIMLITSCLYLLLYNAYNILVIFIYYNAYNILVIFIIGLFSGQWSDFLIQKTVLSHRIQLFFYFLDNFIQFLYKNIKTLTIFTLLQNLIYFLKVFITDKNFLVFSLAKIRSYFRKWKKKKYSKK